ncbi:MAG: hypothetical protein KF770_22870 [Anaerolineae bacterium]|nr:hypothetical protein [Anaerolineae bacterium]
MNVVQVQKVEQVDSEGWLEVRDGHGRLLFKVEPEERRVIHIRRSGRNYVVMLEGVENRSEVHLQI